MLVKLNIKELVSTLRFWFIAVLSVYIGLSVHNYAEAEQWNWSAFYNLASLFLRGFLLSSIFYFLVVYLPSKRKRSIVKNNFKSLYKHIKSDIIREILWCSRKGGRTDIDVTEELVLELFDVTKFRNLFKGGKEGDEGWYAFCNHIQSNPEDFSRLIFKFRILAKQLDFILHNYEIKTQENFDSFKRLELIIIELEQLDTNLQGDEVKVFSRFLWEVFAGFSFVNGERDYDFVDKIIDEI